MTMDLSGIGSLIDDNLSADELIEADNENSALAQEADRLRLENDRLRVILATVSATISGEIMKGVTDLEQEVYDLQQIIKDQHAVLAEVHELSDPRSKTPLQDMTNIRGKVSVALRTLAQKGFLP